MKKQRIIQYDLELRVRKALRQLLQVEDEKHKWNTTIVTCYKSCKE